MKYFQLIERMDQMIRLEKTGDANEFSDRMGISRRQLYYYLDELRDLGLPLLYNRSSKTFFYERNCRLKIEISVREMDDSEIRTFEGGIMFKKSSQNQLYGFFPGHVQPLFT